jgi:hypothetical protein
MPANTLPFKIFKNEDIMKLLNETFEYVFENDPKKLKKWNKTKHLAYLKTYLQELKPYLTVVENDYISRDYIEDYSNYHAHCHHEYGRNSKRIHFFEKTSLDFDSYLYGKLTKDEENSIVKLFIGSMVIKPIPTRFVGNTILKYYPSNPSDSENDVRTYFSTRNYKINLFGQKLEVDSLAFQEQDKSVSVCATAALWSVLSKIYPESIYRDDLNSPSQITQLAGRTKNQSRVFPSKGLEIDQILNVLNQSGLTAEYYIAKDDVTTYCRKDRLKEIVFAYSTYKTPIIIITEPRGEKNEEGYHAVVAVGYRASLKDEEGPIIEGYRKLTKLFVHDDQYGPYSRLTLYPLITPTERQKEDTLKYYEDHIVQTVWDNVENNKANTYIKGIIIPITKRVTIDYDEIQPRASELGTILGSFITYFLNETYGIDAKLYIDLNLWLSNDYKSEIRNYFKGNTNTGILEQVITQNMPKFVWASRIYYFVGNQKNHIFDMIFDATDLKENVKLVTVACYKDPKMNFEEYHDDMKKNPTKQYEEIINKDVNEDYLETIIELLGKSKY